MRSWPFALTLAVLTAFVACDHPKPPPKSSGEVPANSLDDAKLHADAGGNDSVDPTQPYTTKVGEGSSDSPAAPAASGSAATPPGKPAKGAASKIECDKAMDRYLTLEIAGNPQLKGVPPEVIEQAKQMAREQHGDVPCTATRAQYTCAMAAKTTAAWQKCMK